MRSPREAAELRLTAGERVYRAVSPRQVAALQHRALQSATDIVTRHITGFSGWLPGTWA
jgi:hypothetical protein